MSFPMIVLVAFIASFIFVSIAMRYVIGPYIIEPLIKKVKKFLKID